MPEIIPIPGNTVNLFERHYTRLHVCASLVNSSSVQTKIAQQPITIIQPPEGTLVAWRKSSDLELETTQPVGMSMEVREGRVQRTSAY
jgi:hypothetical protein